jgi:YegS/Rv2252/BmrU family lipid kinase
VRACVIFNPTAKGDKARRFRLHLDAVAHDATLLLTTGPGDAGRLAAQAAQDGFDTVVAAGGDGTLNEVVNGLASQPGALASVRLGVLPLGTVNVFARELGLSLRFAEAWQTILQEREIRVDLPRAEWSEAGARQVRFFCQLGGAGLDARAIKLVDWPLKKRIGPLAYVLAGVQALRETAAPITVSGADWQAAGELVLLGSGRRYGGAFQLFPEARLNDGLLHGCVFPHANWATLARVAPVLLLRGRLPESAVKRFHGTTFSLRAGGEVPFEVDGELAGRLPVTFHVAPQRLRVLVP